MNLLNRPERFTVTHLPPISAAPILQHYNPELQRLEDSHLLEAPVDDRGVVKVFATLEAALFQLDPDYAIPFDRCDTHHFVWEKENYAAARNGGSAIPLEYREIPFHKGYMPRQLHNFIHAVIAPPPKPSLEVMESRVRAAKLARHLFKMAQLAARYDQRPATFMTKRRNAWRTEEINEDMLLETLIQLQESYKEQCDLSVFQAEFPLFDINRLTGKEVQNVASYLGKFVARKELNLNPYITSDQTARLTA